MLVFYFESLNAADIRAKNILYLHSAIWTENEKVDERRAFWNMHKNGILVKMLAGLWSITAFVSRLDSTGRPSLK